MQLLLVLLIKPNVQHQAYNHSPKRAKLYSIHIVPSQEMAKHQNDSCNDNNDDTQMFQKSIHNVILLFSLFMLTRCKETQ